MAKIIPSTESTVNTLMPNVKFALGPLIIKKKITLIITVNIDKNPNILFFLLFKIEPSIPLVIFQQSGPILEHHYAIIAPVSIIISTILISTLVSDIYTFQVH